jgi:hypothetical protein
LLVDSVLRRKTIVIHLLRALHSFDSFLAFLTFHLGCLHTPNIAIGNWLLLVAINTLHTHVSLLTFRWNSGQDGGYQASSWAANKENVKIMVIFYSLGGHGMRKGVLNSKPWSWPSLRQYGRHFKKKTHQSHQGRTIHIRPMPDWRMCPSTSSTIDINSYQQTALHLQTLKDY